MAVGFGQQAGPLSTSWRDRAGVTRTGAVIAIFWLAGGVTSTGAVIGIGTLAPFCSFWAVPNTPMYRASTPNGLPPSEASQS